MQGTPAAQRSRQLDQRLILAPNPQVASVGGKRTRRRENAELQPWPLMPTAGLCTRDAPTAWPQARAACRQHGDGIHAGAVAAASATCERAHKACVAAWAYGSDACQPCHTNLPGGGGTRELHATGRQKEVPEGGKAWIRGGLVERGGERRSGRGTGRAERRRHAQHDKGAERQGQRGGAKARKGDCWVALAVFRAGGHTAGSSAAAVSAGQGPQGLPMPLQGPR